MFSLYGCDTTMRCTVTCTTCDDDVYAHLCLCLSLSIVCLPVETMVADTDSYLSRRRRDSSAVNTAYSEQRSQDSLLVGAIEKCHFLIVLLMVLHVLASWASASESACRISLCGVV